MDDVPGMGITTGERRSSQARDTWAGVAPMPAATLPSTPPAVAWSPRAMGSQGRLERAPAASATELVHGGPPLRPQALPDGIKIGEHEKVS